MEFPALSIIVPVYNVRKYIEKCIESILDQTFSDFELILVNDGSTDGSYEMCQKYQIKDPRIKLINQANGGVSKARNAGLSLAKGEWIGFVDADDYIDNDFYINLMSAVTTTKAGIICCGVRAVDSDGIESPHLQCDYIPERNTYLSSEEAFYHYLHPAHRFLYWSPWDKIIRSDIAKSVRFEVGRKYAEDFYYCFQCMQKSDGVYYIPEKKYNYFLRPGSAVRSGKFDISSYDSVFFAKAVYEEIHAMNNSNLNTIAEMNLLVIIARTIRSYIKLADHDDMELKKAYHKCKKILKEANYRTVKAMNIKHIILFIEAKFLPFLFYLR